MEEADGRNRRQEGTGGLGENGNERVRTGEFERRKIDEEAAERGAEG